MAEVTNHLCSTIILLFELQYTDLVGRWLRFIDCHPKSQIKLSEVQSSGPNKLNIAFAIPLLVVLRSKMSIGDGIRTCT